jgi:nucleoid-associated protein YgaU
MQEGAGRIAGGLVLLIALWIGIYWWWPHESKITFAQGEDAVRGVVPKTPDQPKHPDPELKPDPKTTPQPDPQVIIPPEFTHYTVKSGDTFATIAKHFFGSESMASVIARSNPEVSPPTLAAGRVILVPKDPNNIQGIPIKHGTKSSEPAETTAPVQTVVVQSGDTLSKIAQEVYGDFRLASVIYDANKDQLPSEHSLKIGQRLKIPPRPQH